MATLVFSVVGTAIGGPLGQALGALVGNQIDRALFGGGSAREGPRLKELALTTSSYGQPIARHFGRMRVAGTVIWATDIRESSERRSGGKGQPTSTTYSYSASFAVALSSTPLARIGRIWADGNLLRGAGGDLKVAGAMRFYPGTGSTPVDPLIAADRGAQAPAFRDCAYVVFEDLALADFGNRIPALSFEIFASDDAQVSFGQIAPQVANRLTAGTIAHMRGFSDEGGPVLGSLGAINDAIPLSCVTTAQGVRIEPADVAGAEVRTVPERLAAINGDQTPERHRNRAEQLDAAPLALRYYDEDRDYQPGVQRAVGLRPNGRENMVDLPATLTASGARQLASANAQRARWQHERIVWRIGTLDPAIGPGATVRVPDHPGLWRVQSWEWFDRGIDLALERLPPTGGTPLTSDPGALPGPVDLPLAATLLRFVEVPPDGSTVATNPLRLAAAAAESVAWRGAALYAEQGAALVPIGSAASPRAVIGALVEPLAPSPGLLLEPAAQALVELVAPDLGFEPTDITGLALGTNRLLIGGEVLQFLGCEPLGNRIWRLSGLLRGRAGTEDHALSGHPQGESVILLDSRATPLDPASPAAQTATRIAAIGRADRDPVYATIANPGLSRRPPSPVHPRIAELPDGAWRICWSRRARGAWQWQDAVEVPLVEEAENYLVGYGPIDSPFVAWPRGSAEITLSQTERAALMAQHGPAALWVRQIGTYSASAALLIANIF
jgi:hypothetical protein